MRRELDIGMDLRRVPVAKNHLPENKPGSQSEKPGT
jgi:hypothetical protein